jgi:predicted transcriptional regulator
MELARRERDISMQIQLEDKLVHQLEEIAQRKQRDVNELVAEVVEQYVSYETDRERFRAKIRKHMQEHAWLLNELAKR